MYNIRTAFSFDALARQDAALAVPGERAGGAVAELEASFTAVFGPLPAGGEDRSITC